MFALRRDGAKLFLYQPDEGMAVPVLLDFRTKEYSVRMPSIEELEEAYAAYDRFKDVIDAAGIDKQKYVFEARDFSHKYTDILSDHISEGNMTFSKIRELVEAHRSARENSTDTFASEHTHIDAAAVPSRDVEVDAEEWREYEEDLSRLQTKAALIAG